MNPNIPPSHRAGIVGVINPDSNGIATFTSAWIAMKDYESLMAIIQAGVLGAAATLDAKFEQATDGGGTGVKDISPAKAIAQLVKASNDDNEAILQLWADELDVNGGFDFARLSLTIGAAASFSSAVVLGFDPHYGPASDNDLASVVEIVT